MVVGTDDEQSTLVVTLICTLIKTVAERCLLSGIRFVLPFGWLSSRDDDATARKHTIAICHRSR